MVGYGFLQAGGLSPASALAASCESAVQELSGKLQPKIDEADLDGPCEIFWEQSAVSKQAMKRDFQRIRTVLKHVAQEREDIKVIFR